MDIEQHPTAAHAASEFLRDEGEPGDGANWTPVSLLPDTPMGWLVTGVCIVLAVCLGVHFAGLRGWLS